MPHPSILQSFSGLHRRSEFQLFVHVLLCSSRRELQSRWCRFFDHLGMPQQILSSLWEKLFSVGANQSTEIQIHMYCVVKNLKMLFKTSLRYISITFLLYLSTFLILYISIYSITFFSKVIGILYKHIFYLSTFSSWLHAKPLLPSFFSLKSAKTNTKCTVVLVEFNHIRFLWVQSILTSTLVLRKMAMKWGSKLGFEWVCFKFRSNCLSMQVLTWVIIYYFEKELNTEVID